MSERFDGNAGEQFARRERPQHRAQHRQLDVLDAPFPDLVLQHRHAVEDHDPAERRLEAGVEEGRKTGPDAGPGFPLGRRGCHDGGDRIGLDRFVHGAEQRVLAAEVVVERSFGGARPLGDVLDRRGGEALFREHLTGDGDKQVASRFRLARSQPLDTHDPNPTD